MQMSAAVTSDRAETLRSRVKGQSKRLTERVIETLLVVSGLISVFTTAGILYVLASEAIEFFAEVSIMEFLTSTEWTPLFADPHFGILPLLMGTLLTSAIALATAVPFGL